MNRRPGDRALKKALAKLRGVVGSNGHSVTVVPLTPEWAAHVDHRLNNIERQLKLLNSGLLIAVIADIAIRLLGLK